MPEAMKARDAEPDTSGSGDFGERTKLAALKPGKYTFNIVDNEVVKYDKTESQFGREAWGFKTKAGLLIVSAAQVYKPMLERLKKKRTCTLRVRLEGPPSSKDRRYYDVVVE